MYAHIWNEFGTFKICYRKFLKFRNKEEEEKISKNLVATIEEPTCDDFLLMKKVIDYAEAEGLRIEGLAVSAIEKNFLTQVAALPDEDRVGMLETAVRNLAALLERERHQLLDSLEHLKQARQVVDKLTNTAEKLLYTLQVQSAITEIAEDESHCEHLEPARGIYWERRKRTDC